MKHKNYIKNIAIFLSLLIISIPLVFAEEYSMTYDENGNLLYDQETNVYREYNELNQLIRTRINNVSGTILQEYIWDPVKEEIFIKDEFYANGSLKSSTYYFGQDYVVIQNSSGTYNQTFIYQNGVLVGYEDIDGKKRYVLQDHEGSTHLVLNETGGVIEENIFSPYAEPLQGATVSRFSYEAKEYDSLVKDYDFHFRKLRTTGPPIFIQPDTLIQEPYNPQDLNRYSFEKNNPYKYTDENGHVAFVPILIAGGIGGLVGLGTYFLTHDDYTWKGALSYAGGGAVAGAAGAVNLVVAAIGGIGSQVAMNYGDERDLGEGALFSGALSAVSFGLADELLPYARTYLIKNPSSWFTTKTGQTFIANQFTEQAASQTGITAAQFLAQRQSQSMILYDYFKYQAYFSEKKEDSSSGNGGRRSGGGGGCGCGPWGDLREEAENAAPGETAGDIIRRWRERQ